MGGMKILDAGERSAAVGGDWGARALPPGPPLVPDEGTRETADSYGLYGSSSSMPLNGTHQLFSVPMTVL